MSDTVIKVNELSKVYRIGKSLQAHDQLREAVSDFFLSRFRRLTGRRLIEDTEDTIWALKDVSFEVEHGEILGIIGCNGAGKSTLLKILSRITEPTRGRVEIKGRVGSLLEVGTGFHPELTGRENIYLNGAILGMTRAEIKKKFDEIVAFSEIEKFIDTPVKRYSSGMFVRLAFAVAAHLEPEILLVDEVLAVGDASFQKKCLGKMDDVAGEGRTVLFVSHNMASIVSLGKPAICLEEGKIAFSGSPQFVVQRYLVEGTEQSGAVNFESDPSKSAQINGIELIDDGGDISSKFNVNSSIKIKIRYQAKETLLDHRIGVVVSRNDGVEVFVTNSTDWQELSRKLPPGEYISTLHIPDRFLAPGRYFLTVYLGEPDVRTHDRRENVLSFEITGNPFRLQEKRRGMLIYPFKWEIQTVHENSIQ